MKTRIVSSLLALHMLCAGIGMSSLAHAHADASAVSTLSALPMASVVIGGSAAAGAVVALPVALSVSGTVLTVKAVESTARGTLFVLERASDGSQVSLEVIGKSLGTASLVAGTVVTVSVIGAGVVLSAAGEAIAFIPNAVGNALLHNERLTK